MLFEYDIEKSIANSLKHGIDFDRAQELWMDSDLVEIQVASRGEPRFIVIGSIDGKNRSAVITYREGVIRIISVRRSREKEVRLYEHADQLR
jgi:uncharacterized DUF497 family protein